jgi:D-sedoheptulose 7-phosphate isomerase
MRLLKLIKRARYVFVCGNGGSSATAEHMTNDLFSKGVKAICLNSNVSILTMIGNDFGYDQVFGRQLEVYGGKDDLLITISCSGTSPNIVEAQRVARERGMEVYEFERFKGKDRNYERLEDEHLQLVHRIKRAL